MKRIATFVLVLTLLMVLAPAALAVDSSQEYFFELSIDGSDRKEAMPGDILTVVFELHRKRDIDALRAHFDVEQLHFVAADGAAHHIRAALNEMDEKTYELYIKYHLATCEDQELIGWSNHTIDIFRKR